MYKSPLEEFLDLTELQTNPDYVSNLLKTAYSKNITIQDWNTFINQFQALISRDTSTYLGFKNVLKEIRLYQPGSNFVNAVGIPYVENDFCIDSVKLKADTLYGSVEYLHDKKLDRDTSVTDTSKAYVKASDGTQTTIDISSTGTPNALMALNENGQSNVATPTESGHIANKKYVDDTANKKLDKLASSSAHHLAYLKLMDGRDVGYPVSSQEEANTILIRDGNGRASVSTPVSDSQIANKKYVDDELAKFDFIKIVDVRPETGLPNKIYLVPKADTQNQDLFDEWIWINKGTEEEPNFDWEWITTKQLEVDLTPYVKKDEVDDFLSLPLESGISENTVQQDGCITGVKGFYWESIDTNTKTITLSTVNGEFGNEQSFDISNYWAIGDVITIHSNQKWDKCSTITALSGNNITVNNLPFSSHTVEKEHFTDQAVFVSSKPDKGIVDFGKYSVAFGENSKATNYNAVAFGRDNEAYGQYAFTAGRDNKAGYATFVLGRGNTATGEQSFIIGYKNKSSGANSFVSGRENTASGARTFVSGYKSTASGDYALAGGENANATNISSVAFGKDVYASGKYSVALGIGTVAREYATTAVGNNTYALASGAFACGKLTYASGQNSFVSGVGNKDDGNTQAIFGSYNARNDNAIVLVGNGTGNDDRRNVFEILKDGTVNTAIGVLAQITENNTGAHYVIGVGNNTNTQRNFPLAYDSAGSTIVFRDGSGYFYVKTPTKDTHPATKKYVDEQNPVKDGVLTVGDTEITEEQLSKLLETISPVGHFTFYHKSTANRVELEFKIGMTWGDFVSSEYNTCGLTVNGDGQLRDSNGDKVVLIDGYIFQYGTSEIIDGEDYMCNY